MADNCASSQSAEEIVSEMSLSLVKGELKKRGLPVKGKKAYLMARLIVVLKQEESKPSCSQNESAESTTTVPKQALPVGNGSAASTSDHLSVYYHLLPFITIRPFITICQSSNHQLSDIQLLRRNEMILKMDIDAVIQVILETSKSSSNNVIKMKNRVQKLDGYMESCSKVRGEIIALIPDDEIAEEAQKWIDYQRAIDNALGIAQEYISKLSVSKVDEQTSSGSAEHKQSHLKLPKLELPKFDGDVLKFQNFWDQFEAAVHDNDNVSAVQKFTYLRSVLEGVAYHTIDGFEVTSANYHHAVDALKHRFGRKIIIISSLVKSIVQLEPRSNERVASLPDLRDTLKNRIRALKALGEKPMTHSCILLPILETKLPPELSEKWEVELTDVKEESVDLELSFKFLNKQVISKEAGERNATMISEDGETARGNGGRDKDGTAVKNTQEKVFSAAALLASGAHQGSNAACHLCKEQGHETLKSPQLKRESVKERWQLVRENRVCFNCLKPANTFHYSSVCRQPKCSVEGCERRHHTMLHGDGDRSTEGQRQTTLSGFVASYNSKMQQMLLQTGTAMLVADGVQRAPVKVLLDSRSQRSYITKKVAESLALDGPSEVLSVSMLGGETSQTKRMRRVSFSLISC